MPAVIPRPYDASDLIDYGHRQCDPRANEGIKSKLREMGLTDNPINRAAAVHLLINDQLVPIEAAIDRWTEFYELMQSVQMKRGSILVEMRIARDDLHRFNDDLLSAIELLNKIAYCWHRFAQASMILNSPGGDEKR
jgi:hypothetical protein